VVNRHPREGSDYSNDVDISAAREPYRVDQQASRRAVALLDSVNRQNDMVNTVGSTNMQ